MSTRAAQRVQEWRQEVPTSSSSTGPSTGTRVHLQNESLWDTLFIPSQPAAPSQSLAGDPQNPGWDEVDRLLGILG